MDNKITLKRLKTFFTYDAIKLVAAVVAVCFALLIVFNAVAKKPSYGQDYYMLVADNIHMGQEGQAFCQTVKNSGVENYGFSYDILRVNNMVIQEAGYSSNYMMNTYVELGEDDVFIVADVEGDNLYNNYISSFFAEEINLYIEQALTYCKTNGFVDDNGNFNTDKIRKNFINTRGKDSRFEKNADFNNGVQNEIARIKAIYKNAVVLKKVLENHPELLYKEETLSYNDKVVEKGYYALKLSALNGKGDKRVENAFSCAVPKLSEGEEITDETIYEYTIENVVVLIGKNSVDEGDLYYESLAFINKLIDTYSTFIDEIPLDEIPMV